MALSKVAGIAFLLALVSVAACFPIDFSWRARSVRRLREVPADQHVHGHSEGDRSSSPKHDLENVRVRADHRVRQLTVTDLNKSLKEPRLSNSVTRPAASEDAETVPATSGPSEDEDTSTTTSGSAEEETVTAGASKDTEKPKDGSQMPVAANGRAKNVASNPGNTDSAVKSTNEGSTETERGVADVDEKTVEVDKGTKGAKEEQVETGNFGQAPASESVPPPSITSTGTSSEAPDHEASGREQEGKESDAGTTNAMEHTDSTPTVRNLVDSNSTVNSVQWVNDTIVVGKNKFRKEQITFIGDIDGNGYTDLVVSSPTARKREGSIRLYLMTKSDQFLYSRELVPGQWGFSGSPLKPGDQFGTAVHKLPTVDTHAPCVIAVGAPGDGANERKRGAVYILQITDKGEISKSTKVSADTDKTLARQHVDNEGFGSSITTVGDLNGDGDYELAVKSLMGSTTMLFLTAHHEVKTSVKMHNSDNTGLYGLVKPYAPKASMKLEATELKSVSVRPGVPDYCFFNETNCACGLKSSEAGSATCLDVVGSDPDTGRTLCQARDCEASFVCSCDGTDLCARSETTRQVYTPESLAGNGQVYCFQTSMTTTINTVLEGVPIPTPEVTEELSPFNATHCRCSLKKELVEPYQCLDFKRTEANIAVVCSTRDCNFSPEDYTCDGVGTSYCTRTFVRNSHYVNDGEVAGEEGAVYCHQIEAQKEIVRRIT